jgi:predicted lipoprotein with Yx(FWY)xxD motif
VTITLQGGHLVGPDGKALYTENVDTATTFGCNGGCLTAWPPVLGAPKAAGGVDQDDFATRARPDGTMQVTYDGKPLYEFQADTAPGDTKGDGVNEGGILWTLAKSDDAPATSPSSSDDDSSGSSSSGSGGGGYGY